MGREAGPAAAVSVRGACATRVQYACGLPSLRPAAGYRVRRGGRTYADTCEYSGATRAGRFGQSPELMKGTAVTVHDPQEQLDGDGHGSPTGTAAVRVRGL